MESAGMEAHSKMNKAAIDIGSNSILLTIIDVNGNTIVDEARVVQLGKGLGDRGQFLPDRMKAAETVFQEFVSIAKTHDVAPYAIQAVATSAARRAMNARTWFCLLYTSPSPRDATLSRMPSSA